MEGSTPETMQPQVSGVEQMVQPTVEELQHEVLAMNTLAMQRCNAGGLDDATTILSDAYMKLHEYTSGGDQRLLDTLRSTTLNNLGVVECHRGQHRQALSHFETARQLEEAWGSVSPSVALNSCAAYNALGMYDKATAAATETIDMLRTLALQKKNENIPTMPDAGIRGSSIQGTGVTVAKSDNKALWGAAWHNMAVAQINMAKYTKDPTEHANAAVLFQNAMRATQELLGRDHPMTKSVTETYRHVRSVLRSYGVFKQHHTMLTVPARPVDPRDEEDDIERYLEKCGQTSRRRAMEMYHRDLTITFCGEATKGVKMTERLDPTPYPGAVEVVFRKQKREKMPRVLCGMPLSETLLKAGQLYGNPHPLLYSLPPNYNSMSSPIQNDGHGTVTTSRTGMTSNNREITSSRKSPLKQRKWHTRQKLASSKQKHSLPDFQNAQSYPFQAVSNSQHAVSNYQRDMPNNQGTPSNYRHSQQSYMPTPPGPQPSAANYQQTPLNKKDASTAYQRDIPKNQGTLSNYQQTYPNHQENTSHYQKAPPNSQVKAAGREDISKDQQAYQRRPSSSSRTRQVSQEVAPHQASAKRFLPPLAKASAQTGGVTPAAVVGANGHVGNMELASQSALHLGVANAGPTYEQVKYILLAEPHEKEQQRGEVGQSLSDESVRHLSAMNGAALRSTGGGGLTDVDGDKAHRLFDAMWVAGTTALDTSVIRTVGRPTYYVSSVVDTSQDHAIMPEEVMQMVVNSCSSSDDDVAPVVVSGDQ